MRIPLPQFCNKGCVCACVVCVCTFANLWYGIMSRKREREREGQDITKAKPDFIASLSNTFP